MNDHQEVSVKLSWKNITGWTKSTLKDPIPKKLLNNVCGVARSGCLSAIVSPSGGGKTTLLAILGRRYKGIVQGDVLINGHAVSSNRMSYISGFVCQKNQLFEDLTVEEHLRFMARLKMDKDCSKAAIEKNIMRVVENLALSHRMHVQLSALSGGQVKRLALAVQLLTEPKILFCDEPTTGLDSYNAVTVVKLLRRIADQGKLIVCAIHQPASGTFEMFDEVSVLVSDGSLAYHGPVAQIREYFLTLHSKCPENYNLCEFIVSQVTIRPESAGKNLAVDDISKIEQIVNSFRQSKLYEQLENELDALSSSSESKKLPMIVFSNINRHQVGFFTQLGWLLWRSLLLLRRSWKTWILRFLLYWFMYCCLSFPYGTIKIDQMGVQNMQGLLNCLLVELLYASLYGVIYVVPQQLTVFVQESADRVYSPFPFYMSHVIILTTKALFEGFFYTNFVFAVTGLNRELVDYVTNVKPALLLAATSCAYGFFLSTAFESITTASLFSVPFELLNNIFAGIYIRLRSMPSHIVWLKYISLTYYAYEALSVNEWVKHSYISCDKKDISECYLNGEQVLASYGFSSENLIMDYIGLSVYTVVLIFIGYLFLLRKLKIIAAY